jgi:hypothetical protein
MTSPFGRQPYDPGEPNPQPNQQPIDADRPADAEQPFDRELRETLQAMAASPAPERLANRVADIPNEEPAMQPLRSRLGLSSLRLGPGFAGLLGVVVIALALFVLRPAFDRPTGVGSSPSASSVAVVPSASVPSTAPSEAPSAVPSSEPSASSAPTSAPTPTPTNAPAPVGFEPVSVTFVSANDGWVLGSVACGTARCAAVERTTDGGHTWAPAGAPKTTVVASIGPETPLGDGVARIRFATVNDGWAFGPSIWSTHDGGATWTKDPIIAAGAIVVALESGHGLTHAVFYDGAQDFRIATSPIASDSWTVSPLQLAVGAGPVPNAQLVLSGATGWILVNNRIVQDGARLVSGTWKSWTPACASVTGPAVLAASSATDVIASCDVGLFGNAQGNHLFVSSNGGTSFAETGSKLPVTMASGAATPDTSTIVVAGSDSKGTALAGSFDSGTTWSTVLSAGAVTVADLGFTTQTQGVVITASANGSSKLLMTRDGGHIWSAVAF